MTTLFFVMVLGTEMLCYYSINPTIVIQQAWIDNITQKCPPFNAKTAFGALSLEESGRMGGVFGASFGMIFAHKFCSPHAFPEKYGVLKWFGRFLLFAVIAVLFYIPYEMVSKEANIYLQLLLKVLLPQVLGYFSIFGLFDIVCIKLSLYLELKT